MDKGKKKDIAYSIAKAGLSSVPIVGAAASELLQLIVTPPLVKRRTEWMDSIGERIEQLESQKNIDVESLKENDIFIDVVLQTTQQALKTSEKEKLNYYKNVIINTAIGEHPELSEIQIFLNLISNFTVWHIKILKLFDNPTDWFEKHNLSVPNYKSASRSSILEIAFPNLKSRRDFYDLIWGDLHRAALSHTLSLQTIISGSGLMSELMSTRTSEFGKKFLKFICEN